MKNFEKWTGDGLFGRWEEDAFGLPSYIFSPKGKALTHKPETTEPAIQHSPWHQIGNLRVTATVHEDGYLQLYNSDRGLVCITPYEPELHLFGGAVGMLAYDDGKQIILRKSLLADGTCKEIRFGMGYGKFVYDVNGTLIELLHWIPDGDDPLVITDISLNTANTAMCPSAFCLLFSVGNYFIDFDPICSGKRRERYGPPPVFTSLSFITKNIMPILRLNTSYRRMRFAKKFLYEAETLNDGAVRVTSSISKHEKFNKEKPAAKPQNPLVFFSKGDDGNIHVTDSRLINPPHTPPLAKGDKEGFEKFSHPVVVAHTFDINKSKQNQTARAVWGYAEKENIPSFLKSADKFNLEKSLQERKKRLCVFNIPDVPWVKREWMWHSDYLQSAALYDEYFENHTVKQGSAYYFLQGMDGAPRDHALFCVPLTYLNPSLAKEILATTLRYTYESGQISYGMFGYGKCSGFGVHEHPGDLPATFLWALTEYIFATRDFAFLDEAHPYYPIEKRKTRTVREQIEQTCHYILNVIGTGKHGLMRVGTGDWNDPLQFHVRNRFAFLKNGESAYNTAMALYVLPRVIAVMETWNKNLSQTLREFTQNLKDALLKQWNGEWLYRAWDGKGRPVGKKHLYLEHHGWALVSDVLPDEQKKKIGDVVYEKLDSPSPIGAVILMPPRKLFLNIQGPGWDTNGGVWHAANMFLTWGYSKVNPDYARESLLKNTLCAHAEAYPHIWFGIWSAPDAYNAHDARNPGETFYHVTPMTDFPVMNANMHANPITAALKLCGIEPTLDGFYIAPKLPDKKFSLRTPLLSIERDEKTLSFSYRPVTHTGKLQFTVEDVLCASKTLSVKADGKNISFNRNTPSKISFEFPLSRQKELSWILNK